MDDGSKVIMVSEPWLWPYELQKLDDIHPDLIGSGKSDSRLSEVGEGLSEVSNGLSEVGDAGGRWWSGRLICVSDFYGYT